MVGEQIQPPWLYLFFNCKKKPILPEIIGTLRGSEKFPRILHEFGGVLKSVQQSHELELKSQNQDDKLKI